VAQVRGGTRTGINYCTPHISVPLARFTGRAERAAIPSGSIGYSNGVTIWPASLVLASSKSKSHHNDKNSHTVPTYIVKSTSCQIRFPGMRFLMASWVEGSCLHGLPDGLVVGSRKRKQAFSLDNNLYVWRLKLLKRSTISIVLGIAPSPGTPKCHCDDEHEAITTMEKKANLSKLTPSQKRIRITNRLQASNLLGDPGTSLNPMTPGIVSNITRQPISSPRRPGR